MIFDLTANTNRRKLMVLDPSYPKDVSTTVIKGKTTSATFSVVITEPGSPDEYTYQWYVNGSAVSGANSPSYTRTGLSATATYTVYCEVTNNAGTVKSRVAALKVTQYYTPTLNASYPANATVVIGNSVTSKVTISTAGVPASYTYQWYKNGTAVSGATGSSYTFTPTAVGTTTVYCKVTNAAGTVTSRTATITATVCYLYNSGDQCTDITGGWDQGIKPGSGYAGSGNHTINSDNIKISITDFGAWSVYTKNKIDLSLYSTITVEFDGPKIDSSRVLALRAITDLTLAQYGFANTSAGAYCYDSTQNSISVNVSSVSTLNYIVISYDSAREGSSSVTIKKVYLS